MNSKNFNAQEMAASATAMKKVSEKQVINKEKRIVTVEDEELKKFMEHQKTLVSTTSMTLEEYINYLEEHVNGSSTPAQKAIMALMLAKLYSRRDE